MEHKKITRTEAIRLIDNFCKAFDEKDWDLMAECLSDQVELDYRSLRGTPVQRSTPAEYIAQRKKGMAGLRTSHMTSQHKTSGNEREIRCVCQFEIKRFERGSEAYFHSYGKYDFGVKPVNGELKIVHIKQTVERNEGNQKIHGAFKK